MVVSYMSPFYGGRDLVRTIGGRLVTFTDVSPQLAP
jgi:hypothetical protein